MLVKKKSRLGLGFGWDLGDRADAGVDIVPTLNKKSSQLGLTISRKPSMRITGEEERGVPIPRERLSKISLGLSKKSSMIQTGSEDRENALSRSGTLSPSPPEEIVGAQPWVRREVTHRTIGIGERWRTAIACG